MRDIVDYVVKIIADIAQENREMGQKRGNRDNAQAGEVGCIR